MTPSRGHCGRVSRRLPLAHLQTRHLRPASRTDEFLGRQQQETSKSAYKFQRTVQGLTPPRLPYRSKAEPGRTRRRPYLVVLVVLSRADAAACRLHSMHSFPTVLATAVPRTVTVSSYLHIHFVL